MSQKLADLVSLPDHYLHSFDGDEAVFVPMDRAAYRRSIFLDGRISAVAPVSLRVPVSALLPMVGQPQQTAWIFHIAHCGSTLLARALDELSEALVLREPLALRQVSMDFDERRLALVLAMLSRRYPGQGPTLVKANVPVNMRLESIGAYDPHAPAIMLYAKLDDYLLAVLRSDQHRAWLRRITTQLGTMFGTVFGDSNAERAAALWLAQMRWFASALRRMPNARSLEAETFFSQPLMVLKAAGSLLARPFDRAAVASVVSGALFHTYSKDPTQAFDNDVRLAQQAELRRGLAPQIEMAQRWLDRAAPDLNEISDCLSGTRLTN